MSATLSKNRQAWRDRPDTVLVSIRRRIQPWRDLKWRPIDRVILTYTVLGTRAECEASNGGAPVDPGVYGPETIVTAWDLGLVQSRLQRVRKYRPPPPTASLAPDERSCERYERKIIAAIADRFFTAGEEYKCYGVSGAGHLWVDYEA